MKRVRITIDPTDMPLRPLYHRLAGGEGVERTQIVNWNVADPPTAFLFRIRGDYEALEADLEGCSHVTDYEIMPLTDRECHCFLEGEATPGSRELFRNFTRGGLLTVPPVAINRDGTSTFTLVGTRADIQAAVEGVPEPVGVTVADVADELDCATATAAEHLQKAESVVVAALFGGVSR